MNYHTILWDFDGTLVDTSPGIMACICYACAQLKQPEPEKAVLRKFIGPPLYDSFQAYLGYSPPLAEEATRIYRKYYEKDGRVVMPVSVQAHHSFVDGIHIGQFADRLQKYLNEL